jgi:hypothetical protein
MVNAQRVSDAATLLPIAAAILLLPPFILVFSAPVLIAGVPLIVVYVFGVWAAIILCAWLLARSHEQVDAGADAFQPDASPKTEKMDTGAEPPGAD